MRANVRGLLEFPDGAESIPFCDSMMYRVIWTAFVRSSVLCCMICCLSTILEFRTSVRPSW